MSLPSDRGHTKHAESALNLTSTYQSFILVLSNIISSKHTIFIGSNVVGNRLGISVGYQSCNLKFIAQHNYKGIIIKMQIEQRLTSQLLTPQLSSLKTHSSCLPIPSSLPLLPKHTK